MKIKWALNELKKFKEEPLTLNGEIDLTDSLIERNSSIIDATPLSMDGILVVERTDEFLVDLNLTISLTLPSSRSLEPVKVDLRIPFSETYLVAGTTMDPERYGEDEIVVELESDSLDLRKPLEDAILTAIPTQVFTEEELEKEDMPSGSDWKVVSEGAYGDGVRERLSEEEDPRFAALKGLFSEENE
ncbi:YceD family protein [Marinilactibacillus sp. GCM10026970]|uniref:YceD family protein n=1 Tax=Marinilactibacillus sp. GCM10026970 TaxID=3252642 RepID=UPI00361F20A9